MNRRLFKSVDENVLLQCCSDGGSIELSPSSPTEVDLLELSPDTSDSEDEDWWNNESAVECGSKVKACTVTGVHIKKKKKKKVTLF
jgi:hypothetical protein